MNPNPMELFQEETPEIATAFHNLIKVVAGFGGLDGKTK
jgi:hypothetical protein